LKLIAPKFEDVEFEVAMELVTHLPIINPDTLMESIRSVDLNNEQFQLLVIEQTQLAQTQTPPKKQTK